MALTRCPQCTRLVFIDESWKNDYALLNTPNIHSYKNTSFDNTSTLAKCACCDHQFSYPVATPFSTEKKEEELRLYSVCNMYFSGIHAGIQTQHSTVELLHKYKDTVQEEYINEWAENHKTTIVLSGGMDDSMQLLLSYLENSGIPFAPFYEVGVNENALSSISFILSESEYNLMRSHESKIKVLYDEEPYVFFVLNHIKNLPLAK